MDKVEEKLLDILKEEVLKEEGADVQNLTTDESRELVRLAKEHTVLGFIANAVCSGRICLSVSRGQDGIKKQTVLELMQYHMLHQKQYQQFEHTISDFADLMNKNQIPYVVFKGMAVAQFYPSPYSRTMGDVDFYVPASDFDKAVGIIESELKVTIEKDEIDKHFCFDYHDIRFEMHYQIETFGNAKHQKYFNLLIDTLLTSTSSFKANGKDVAMLPPLADLMVVFKHWFNHLLIEGVGLRQTLDLLVLLNAYEDKIDFLLLQKHLKAIGYWKAFKAMVAMMEQRLGLVCVNSYCHLESADYTYGELILREVLSSGNFGRKAYKYHIPGKKKSMETAQRALGHCLKFFCLAPWDICCLLLKRIIITLKQKRKNEQ